MVLRNPPLAEPVKYPGGVKSKPPFEMGVANFEKNQEIKFVSHQVRQSLSSSVIKFVSHFIRAFEP